MDRNTSADDCFDTLLKRYKISDRLSISQKTTLVSIHYNMELENYSNSNPYVFAKNISRSAVNAVSENTQGVSGVEIQTYLTRGASDPDLAPHILGALGSLSEDEYNELKKQGKSYSYDDKIGKFGIELACEDDLKGKGGKRVIQRNADGTLVESIETESAKPGNTVYLTIDSKLQKTAAKSLEENVKAAKQAGKESGQKNNGEDCETGAVVMLSVKDFSVLAAASYPTYDLNRYSEYGSYYVKLSENKNSPMYNRATVGTFACGSVFKPCVAGAALEEKIITDKTKIYCKQDYDFYPTNVVRCMHYHGSLDVTGAIEQSCNYFFADTGRRLGIEPMYLYAQKFGFGEYTGVEIEESKGTLEGKTGKSTGNITTEKSGCFLSHCDGYENALDYSNLDRLTLSDLDNVKQTKVSGNIAGKVVTGLKWYVACKVTADEATRLSLWNGSATVLFSDASSESIPATIKRIYQESKDSDALLILECDYMNSDLAQARQEPIEIGLGSYTGLRISKKAIHDDYVTKTTYDDNDNKHTEQVKVQGVYVLHGSEVRFKQISILYADDDYVICDPEPDSKDLVDGTTVELYDQVILEGDDLYDGKVVN